MMGQDFLIKEGYSNSKYAEFTSDWVIYGSDILNYDNTDNFSISAWVYPTSLPTITMVVSNSLGGLAYLGYALYISSGAPLFRYYQNGTSTGSKLQYQSTLSINTWYHIVATFESGTVKLYVNGVVNTTSQSGSGFTGSTDLSGSEFKIGSIYPTNTYSFSGDLDEVSFYNRVLTQTQVNSLYSAGNPESTIDPNTINDLEFGVNFEDGTFTDIVNGEIGVPTGITTSNILSYINPIVTYNFLTTADGDFLYKPAASAFCTEYQAVYDAMGTKPSAAVAANQNTLVETLIAGGVWSLLDIFYLLAGNTENNSLLNWITPASFKGVAYNSPTFTAFEGFTGNGTSTYINTVFTPSTDAVQFTRYDAMVGVYARTVTQNNGAIAGVKATGTGSFLTYYSGKVSGFLNSTGGAGSTQTLVAGIYSVIRYADDDIQLFQNTTQIDADTDATGGVAASEMYILGNNDGGFTDAQLSFYWVGGSLTTAKLTILVDAIEVYMDSNSKGIL